MIRVRLDHIPGVADQDFDCETASDAVDVLLDYGTSAVQAKVLAVYGGRVALPGGGTIDVSYGEEV